MIHDVINKLNLYQQQNVDISVREVVKNENNFKAFSIKGRGRVVLSSDRFFDTKKRLCLALFSLF